MKNLVIKKLKQLIQISRLGMVLLVCLLFGMMTAYARSNDATNKPVNLTRADTCPVCGMIVLDYSGPHAQIVWKNGTHAFYCDLNEIMPQLLNSSVAARMAAVYVQDFDGLKWGAYKNHWANAKDTIDVIDSNKKGAMGISYVPFKSMANAKAFQKENGGKIVKYAQINKAVLQKSHKLMLAKPDLYDSPKMKNAERKLG